MKQAVIVSTARTGLAKSYRGAFNMKPMVPQWAGYAVQPCGAPGRALRRGR